MVEQQQNSKTTSLGVNVDAELRRDFKKRCNELKYKERAVIESLMRVFLNLDDVDAQSKLVRGEAKIIATKDRKGSVSKRILSGVKSLAL